MHELVKLGVGVRFLWVRERPRGRRVVGEGAAQGEGCGGGGRGPGGGVTLRSRKLVNSNVSYRGYIEAI